MKSYALVRSAPSLAYFLVAFAVTVLSRVSALSQLVIDYPRNRGAVVISFMEFWARSRIKNLDLPCESMGRFRGHALSPICEAGWRLRFAIDPARDG